MDFSTLLTKCLIEEGVTRIYGLAGESNINFLSELKNQHTIRYMSTANESGAAFMAATEGRLTGKPGVLMTTLGPGALNACNGIAYSFLGGFPIVFLSWQGSSTIGYRDNKFQVIDIKSLYAPIVKEAISVNDPEFLTSYIRNAFELSIEGKPGPILLEIPENVSDQMVNINTKPLKKNKTLKLHPDRSDLETAMEILNTSKKPLIINGIRSSTGRISKSLMEFVDHTKIPCISTHMGQGSVHGKYHLGNFYKSNIKDYQEICQNSDLIITIGYDTLEYSPLNWNIGHEKKIIDIDIAYSTRHYQFNPDISLQGDIGDTIDYLLKNARPQVDCELPIINKDLQHQPVSGKIHPRDLIDVLSTIENSRFLHDNGLHKLWMTKYFKAKSVNQVVVDNTLASMGAGIPSGIVSKLVDPGIDTYICIGDGGLLMTLGEVATAKESNLDLTILIWNSNSHGMIDVHFEDKGLEPFGTHIANYKYEKLDQVFGAVSYCCQDRESLKKALTEARRVRGLKILNILVDYSDSLTHLQ